MVQYIWLVSALIFGGFAVYHFWRAGKALPKAPNNARVKAINGANLGIHEFIEGFNKYVDDLNRDNRKLNIWTGVAYVMNAAIAIFSWHLSS